MDKFSILLVNDGSKDSSLSIIKDLCKQDESFQLLDQSNMGHGNAIINGYAWAQENHFDLIFQCDSDNQIEAKEFSKIWAARNSSEVWGVRRKRQDPKGRLIISVIMKTLIRFRFRKSIPDPNVPFRLMTNSFLAAQLPYLQEHRPFAPNIYLSIAAAKFSPTLKFVDVIHQERDTGTGSLLNLKLLRVCFRSFSELLKFSFKR